MSRHVKPVRVPEVSLRPELRVLREDILSRIPPVTGRDLVDRFSSVVDDMFDVDFEGVPIYSKEFDVRRLADDYGVDFGGLDVPERVSLVRLYLGLGFRDEKAWSTASLGVGLRRGARDPAKGMVSNQWLYHDFPEEKPPNAHQLGDVTCWAKYHVIVPEEDRELSIPYRTHDGMQRNAVIPGEGSLFCS
jgi:hypothetical protein